MLKYVQSKGKIIFSGLKGSLESVFNFKGCCLLLFFCFVWQ